MTHHQRTQPTPVLAVLFAGAYLLAYGVATAVGSYAGGRFADANARRALVVGSLGVGASLLAMRAFGGNPLFVALTVVGLGLFAMGTAPSLQHRVVTLAGPGAPLASSLPASAVNAGIALGSLAGGVAIGAGGVAAAVTTGAVIALVAVATAWATSAINPPDLPPAVDSPVPLINHR
jgi:DHA1 family inner membrane transport protein